jgi:hypothetical protein
MIFEVAIVVPWTYIPTLLHCGKQSAVQTMPSVCSELSWSVEELMKMKGRKYQLFYVRVKLCHLG